MNKLAVTIALGLVTLPMLASQASAEPPGSIEAGALLGWMKPSVSGGSGSLTDGRIGIGLQADYRLLPGISAGAFWMTAGRENNVTVGTTTLSQKVTYSPYGLQGAYHFEDFFLGLRLGLTKTSLSTTGSEETSTTDFTFGPYIGTDFPATNRITLGAEASILWAGTDPDTTTLLALMGTVKYHF